MLLLPFVRTFPCRSEECFDTRVCVRIGVETRMCVDGHQWPALRLHRLIPSPPGSGRRGFLLHAVTSASQAPSHQYSVRICHPRILKTASGSPCRSRFLASPSSFQRQIRRATLQQDLLPPHIPSGYAETYLVTPSLALVWKPELACSSLLAPRLSTIEEKHSPSAHTSRLVDR